MKKALNKMKISRKLITGFLLISIFSLLIGAIGIYSNKTLSNAGLKLYEENTLGISYLGQAASEFQQLRYKALEMTTYLSASQSKEEAAKLEELCSSITDLMLLYSATIQDNAVEVKALYEESVTVWNKYNEYIDKAVTFVEGNKNTFAADVIKKESYQTGEQLYANFSKLIELSIGDAKNTSDTNSAMSISINIGMIVVVVVALLLSILIGGFIARLVSKPLIQMASVADRLAMGDVDVEIEIDSNDEIAQLARSFSTVVESTRKHARIAEQLAAGDLTIDVEVKSDKDLLGQKLSELVADLRMLLSSIATSADQVSSGAKQVSDSSTALSQGAAEQASSVEELTVSLDQIATQTKLNAENALQINQLAERTKLSASSSNMKMQEMLTAMDEINASSSGISKIIKVIDDIAFQTNILALNAAVEAACAGVAGKGFSVVAEEVKNLAQKSAAAAKETTDMIENSIKKVHDGTKIANTTAETLKVIIDEIDQVAALIRDITTASNEQAAGIDQINKGIMQVSQVVQANSATSEESAAASEELSSQAEMLNQMIGKFKLKKTEELYYEQEEDDSDFISLPGNEAEPYDIDSDNQDMGKYV